MCCRAVDGGGAVRCHDRSIGPHGTRGERPARRSPPARSVTARSVRSAKRHFSPKRASAQPSSVCTNHRRAFTFPRRAPRYYTTEHYRNNSALEPLLVAGSALILPLRRRLSRPSSQSRRIDGTRSSAHSEMGAAAHATCKKQRRVFVRRRFVTGNGLPGGRWRRSGGDGVRRWQQSIGAGRDGSCGTEWPMGVVLH